MDIVTSRAGIDVAKATLAISIEGRKAFAIGNEEGPIKEALKQLPPGCEVHLESSGAYERLVKRLLVENGFTVHTQNPLKTKRLAQAIGAKAKTDAVDAVALAENAHLIPAGLQKSGERQGLCDLSRSMDAIQKTITELKLRSQMPELDSDAKALYEEAIQALRAKLKEAEKRFEERVKSSSYRRYYELCLSVPGVGKVTARTIVCELPEDFIERTGAQIATYAGLAPIDESSGTKHGAKLSRGNHRLKKAFYMPALWCIRHQDWAKELYARLRTKGKSHQTAAVAVMRRLLVRVVATLQRGSAWQAEPPNP
jgi:transposase